MGALCQHDCVILFFPLVSSLNVATDKITDIITAQLGPASLDYSSSFLCHSIEQ